MRFVEGAVAEVPAPAPGVPWTQWGGPKRNFQTDATGIKDVWPASGPRVVWKRALGEGYSAPVVENGVLYTMYGKSGQEVVLAANAETGQTLWEHVTPMTFQSDAPEMGNGPYSSPLIAGDRLFTTGVAGRLQGLDKKSGKLLWTQQLWSDHHGSQMMYGYSSSPIAFRDTVVVRGEGPMAPRDPIVLKLPNDAQMVPEGVQQEEQAGSRFTGGMGQLQRGPEITEVR